MAQARKRTQARPVRDLEPIDNVEGDEYDSSVSLDFDLDALEDKGPEPKPFMVKLGGKMWEFRNPRTMDWRESAALDEAETGNAYMRLLVGEDQWEEFREQGVEMWKIEAALGAWRKHFGLTEGKADGSSDSSSGTGKRSRRTSRTGR